MEIFGKRIKELLVKNGISQKELADRLHVGRTTLCEWLNNHNEPSMQTIVDIANIFDVSTDYLLGRTEDY